MRRLRHLGYKVKGPLGSSHDRIGEGRTVKLTFSTVRESGDEVFQQLQDQDDELVLLLSASPAVAHGRSP